MHPPIIMIPFLLLIFSPLAILLVQPGEAAQARRRPNGRSAIHPDTSSKYDRSITTFSSEGRLLQVEYGAIAAGKGSTVTGLDLDCLSNSTHCDPPRRGIVLAVRHEARPSSSTSACFDKVQRIDDHALLITSGLSGDSRALASTARVKCQNLRMGYGEAPMLSEVANMVGSAQHELTRIGGARPFGVSAIVAGIDPLPDQQRQGNASSIAGDEHKGTIGVPLLFRTDPGGAVDRCDFCAIGKGSEGAITALETAVNFALKQLEESDKHRDDGVHEQIIFDALRGVAMAAMDSDADTSLRPPLSDDHRQGRDGEEDNGNAVDLWLIEGSPNRRGAARFAVARSVGRKDLDKAVKLLLHN